jgi:hypothetical protein
MQATCYKVSHRDTALKDAEHIICLEEMRNAHKILVEKHEKMSLGEPVIGKKNNIKVNIKKPGCETCLHMDTGQ